MRPAVLSSREMSPCGAVRNKRGPSRPVAYCSTLKPAGAMGHTFAGRATTSGPFSADFVAYGWGRSSTVIFRVSPGFSYRKSANGGWGGGALRLEAVTPGAGGCRVIAAFLRFRGRTHAHI